MGRREGRAFMHRQQRVHQRADTRPPQLEAAQQADQQPASQPPAAHTWHSRCGAHLMNSWPMVAAADRVRMDARASGCRVMKLPQAGDVGERRWVCSGGGGQGRQGRACRQPSASQGGCWSTGKSTSPQPAARRWPPVAANSQPAQQRNLYLAAPHPTAGHKLARSPALANTRGKQGRPPPLPFPT